MPTVIGKRLAAGFGLAIILLVANAIISFRAINTVIENNKRVVHTQQVIETLGEAMNALTTAETSQRGFIITGDDDFLAFYRETVPRLNNSIARLKGLIADNPLQSQRLQEFERAVDVRRETLEYNLELRRTQGIDFIAKEGRLLMGRA